MKTVLLALVFAGSVAWAQDPGVVAAQQADQVAQQIQLQQNLLAAGQQSLDTQQMIQINQLMIQQAQASTGGTNSYFLHIPPWNTWKVDSSNHLQLSIRSGTVKSGTEVRIKWRGDEYGAVYYTLDGWTPTFLSTRYTGPIAINGPVHLRATGVGWGWNRSPVVDAEYNVTSNSTSLNNPVIIDDSLLRAGTVLKLKTEDEVNSNSAKPGDNVPLMLDQDVVASGAVVIPKGTPVDAVLTQAAPPKGPHRTAMLVLAVRSLRDSRGSIKLLGIETMEGRAGRDSGEAIIEPGMAVYAKVAADTKLRP